MEEIKTANTFIMTDAHGTTHTAEKVKWISLNLSIADNERKRETDFILFFYSADVKSVFLIALLMTNYILLLLCEEAKSSAPFTSQKEIVAVCF